MLGKIINPMIAINLIKKQLKKQFKKEIEVFDIIYSSDKNKLSFKIEGKMYDMDSESLKTAIQTQAGEYLEKGQTMDYIILQINFKSVFAKIYFTENGEKEFVEQKIS